MDGYALAPVVTETGASDPTPEAPPSPPLSSAVQTAKPEPLQDEGLTYPDYQWSARDAWKYLGIILALKFIFPAVVSLAARCLPAFHHWRSNGTVFLAEDLVRYALYFITALYFARTETIASVLRGFGLDGKPSNRVWFGIVAALAIRGFGHLIRTSGLSKGVSVYEFTAFKTAVGLDRYFFLIPPVLLAPFFEEAIYRGFIYKALRNSHPIWGSMAILPLTPQFSSLDVG